MQFRTEFKTTKSELEITHLSSIFNVGSCFAANMNEILVRNKFKTFANPFGIIYNPVSIFNSLSNEFQIEKQNFVVRDDIWYSLDFHSDINALSADLLFDKIQKIKQTQSAFLRKTDVIIFTFGTAYVFENSQSKLVANCHKLPANLFTKRLLDVNEIVVLFERLYKNILEINPNITFIFTVSPVRHIKDTIELNNVSKSILRIATHYISEKFSNCYYFPAYEILMDDLRDYRFYDKDLLHPNETSIEYIWQKFSASYFSIETQNLILKWQQILSSLNHRSFNPKSVSHQQFLNQLSKDLANFEAYFDVSEETKFLKSQLI